MKITSEDRTRYGSSAIIANVADATVGPVLIGRLADHEGLGLGAALVEHCLAVTISTNQQIACRAIIVNAIDEAAYHWWERLGFRALDPNDSESLDLYLLTKEVEDVLDQTRRTDTP